MEPSSRTPEGWPNRCPVCGMDVCIEPSVPPGDAPCPHCGHLLWFAQGIPERAIEGEGKRCDPLFQHATRKAGQGNFDGTTELLIKCVSSDPGNYTYVRALLENLQERHSNKQGGLLAQFLERSARSA